MALPKPILLAGCLLYLVSPLIPNGRSQFVQQGSKLVGAGWVDLGGGLYGVLQGRSVAVSADGSTALLGGPQDNGGTGAVWVFTRANGAWSQQGNKLVASLRQSNPDLKQIGRDETIRTKNVTGKSAELIGS